MWQQTGIATFTAVDVSAWVYDVFGRLTTCLYVCMEHVLFHTKTLKLRRRGDPLGFAGLYVCMYVSSFSPGEVP